VASALRGLEELPDVVARDPDRVVDAARSNEVAVEVDSDAHAVGVGGGVMLGPALLGVEREQL